MVASKSRKSEGIELNEDLPYQRRMWRAERIGWALMLLVVVAACVGVFGLGPLSDARVDAPNAALTLSYERFTRHGLPGVLRVEFSHARGEEDTLATVWFDREFIEGLTVQQITPQPAATEVDGDGVAFSFLRRDSGARAFVTFDVVAERRGARRGWVGAARGTGAPFRQVVFP